METQKYLRAHRFEFLNTKRIIMRGLLGVLICFNTSTAKSQHVYTFAGNGMDSLMNGFGQNASFGKCFGIGSDDAGNLYIPDTYNNVIRKIDSEGNVSTFAGSGKMGNKDGDAKEAQFSEPAGAYADNKGNVFIADWGGNKIRKIDSKGIVSTIAGLDSSGYVNGSKEVAMFCAPRSCCMDLEGNIYVGDCWNHSIRKITPNGMVSNLAGGGQPYINFNNGSWKDGTGTDALFDAPCGVTVDKYGNVYTADANNNKIRKITPKGVVTTIAGSIDDEGITKGLKDGAVDSAMLWVPTELVVDDEGYIFIGDSYNNCVRMLTPDGVLYTIAGNGEKGYKDGENSICDSPRGVTLIGKDLYFFDHNNNRVRFIKNPKAFIKKKYNI